MAAAQQGTSQDTKTIVTVLLLVFVYPVGVIVMWFWTTWPKWVKVILTLILVLAVIFWSSMVAAIVGVSGAKVNKSTNYQMSTSTPAATTTLAP